jgi:cytochrome b involved in lipid metabolism
MMKRLYFASTIAFWLAFIAFWGASLWMHAEQKVPARPTIAAYTLGDVAKHDQSGDCWMVIGGNVYDLTGYLSQHPTRPDVIVSWCGKEATVAYNTKNRDKNRSRPHSSYASNLLQQYQIGVLQDDVAR